VGDKKIAAVLGGMHLKRAGRAEINELIEYFRELDLELLAPMHCTGRQAAAMFKEALGDTVKLASVGDNFEF
jgi:7,8-dihydropterin-6-yl-methyl-4-(beta-D-ribofuranosyl)aminobenzene 5'-phosphate synthase